MFFKSKCHTPKTVSWNMDGLRLFIKKLLKMIAMQCASYSGYEFLITKPKHKSNPSPLFLTSTLQALLNYRYLWLTRAKEEKNELLRLMFEWLDNFLLRFSPKSSNLCTPGSPYKTHTVSPSLKILFVPSDAAWCESDVGELASTAGLNPHAEFWFNSFTKFKY